MLWNQFQILPVDRVKRMRSAVRALRALREAQNHPNATLAGQQENRRGLTVNASLFPISE
jgi:hypothetical protein